jgi:transposase
VLEDSRWLLLKDPKTLDEDEERRLQRTFELNNRLLPQGGSAPALEPARNHEDALQCLKRWCQRTKDSGIPILLKFAELRMRYGSAIPAWRDFPISNGPLEGTHNKIKTMQRMAYGCRHREFVRLRIYALHECKYAFVG